MVQGALIVRWLPLALVVAGLLAAPARAEETGTDAGQPPEVGGETIELWGERPDRPFRRDTKLVFTAADLAEAGVTDLAEALALVPELDVVLKGRGGMQANIRGARKGAIKILIDGIPVNEPYYGSFDISSLPVTDIEQIRVSLAPSSPVDGVGGSGGVIEIDTRDAVGAPLVRARAQGSDLPAADLSVTGRHRLYGPLAVRGSIAGVLSGQDYEIEDSPASLDEDRRDASGALRVEYRRGRRRLVVDGFAQQRHFVVNPGASDTVLTRVIDRQRAARLGVVGDLPVHSFQLQGRFHLHQTSERSTSYRDPTLAERVRGETLDATSIGGGLLLSRPIGRRIGLVASADLDSDHGDLLYDDQSRGGGRATIGALAAGMQLETDRLLIDLALGVALPIGIGEGPWPEAKLKLGYAVDPAVTLRLTGAHKGRMPTLRELYSSDMGNEDLDPEIASFVQLAAEVAPPGGWVSASVATYLRHSDGIIRFDLDHESLINIDNLTFRGIDATVEIARDRRVSGGASYSFTDEYSTRMGTHTLSMVPMHRVTAWLTGRLGERGGATLRVAHIGDQDDQGQTLPATTDLELFTHYRIWPTLLATLKVGNLVGDHYLIRVSGVRSPGRVFTLGLLGEWR